MEARAAALEELEASGALDDVLAEGDDIDRELNRRSSEQRIDRELSELKTRLGRETEQPSALESEEATG
jgi:phage shock protein A